MTLLYLLTGALLGFAIGWLLAKRKEDTQRIAAQMNTEFENIAHRIMHSKEERFTELNKASMNAILEPLGKDISAFRKKVEEVYLNESRERFSLGEKVRELAELNRVISAEAHNLTRALKGDAKVQGDWGEMILEHILEKSGLRKNHEYFMQEQLADTEGVPLLSDVDGRKMRPDAIIRYPDNRSVIVDSKVSLNAFTRYLEATDADEQKRELAAHVMAIRNHIDSLSRRGYDDYQASLDFVMLFIPGEPAYIAAMQGDATIWDYAYKKRILLMNPTNLITSLKLIEDLWKRENQNINAMRIAEQGGRMYDKLAGFVDTLDNVGDSLNKALTLHDQAMKQLSTGKGNLLSQAEKLKNMGLKTKKSMLTSFVEEDL